MNSIDTGIVHRMVGKHPIMALSVFAVIIVLLIIIFMRVYYNMKGKCLTWKSTSGFDNYGNASSMMRYQDNDQIGLQGYSQLNTRGNRGIILDGSRGNARPMGGAAPAAREHLTQPGACPSGWALQSTPQGNRCVYVGDGDDLASTTKTGCAYTSTGAVSNALWDPLAIAEAQALASTGSLQHDDYGEAALQNSIDGAYASVDGSAGLTDAQLESAMHSGGS
jgi:hypothetical protein